MRLSFVRTFASIAGEVSHEELNDFIVLSGANGSGKSQLLEAIERGDTLVDGQIPDQNYRVKRFAPSQLVAPAENINAFASFKERWVEFENVINNTKSQILNSNPALHDTPDVVENELLAQLVNNRQYSKAGLDKLIETAGKPLVKFERAEFMRHVPLFTGIRDPFTFSIGELFLTYHNRSNDNKFARYLVAEGEAEDEEPISDERFIERFGRPPWEVLDETLELIGLEYNFVRPVGREGNRQFEVQLKHKITGDIVTTALLSSGEKTLLAIAMSLYTGTNQIDAIELPKVLLLDEADASFHPSMIRIMLQVVQTVFTETHGVKVILTTHSPTTVALAPESSLYIMRRTEAPRLIAAKDRDAALRNLTVGIPTLNVKVENNRMVFVESEHDESIYQEVYRLIGPDLGSELALQFVASGRGGQGNCDAVKYLVGKTRQYGNTNVWGLIDRDSRTAADTGIVFNTERYAVENFYLDPLGLGAFCVREQVLAPETIGLPVGTRHGDIDRTNAQRMVAALSALIAEPADDMTLVSVAYRGGFSVDVPKFWLEMQGHSLQDQVLHKVLPLKQFERTLGYSIISKTYGDFPAFIPASIEAVFKQILNG